LNCAKKLLQEYKTTVRICEAEKGVLNKNSEAEPKKHYSYKKNVFI